MTCVLRAAAIAIIGAMACGVSLTAQGTTAVPPLDLFFAAASPDERVARAALDTSRASGVIPIPR